MNNIPEKPKSSLPLIARILRNKTIQRMLYPLEVKTRNSPLVSDGAPIIVTDKITSEMLKDFFENRIAGIHVPGYCSKEIAEHTSENILKKELHNWNIRDVKTGYKTSDVEVFGNPFTTAAKDDTSWTNYFAGAEKLASEMRELSYPYQYPIDRFRTEMDEIWPYGMMTGTYKDAKMVPGLVRVMHEKKIEMPEDISLGCHVDDTPILSEKKGKFSVNIYLKPAPKGGNLFVWNTKISGLKDFFSKWYLAKNFFLDSNYMNEELQRSFQAMLPKPTEIKVNQGDLVLINTGRPHAVSHFTGGTRVSLQSFITYKKDQPLRIWA